MREPRGLGQRGELLLLIVTAGLHHSGRHQERHRRLDRDVEVDDVAARHVEKEAGRRIGGAGHEGRNVLGVRQPRRDVGACGIRQEDQRPHAGRGKLDEADPAEARAALGKQRLEDLLEALVDRPHDRHAVEDVLPDLDEFAADEIRGQKTEQRQCNERDDEPEAWDLHRQVGLWPIGERDEGPHQIVDPVDEPPGEADGDIGRPDQDQPGQKIIAQPADRAGMEWRRLVGRGRVGVLRRRQAPRISFKLVHHDLPNIKASRLRLPGRARCSDIHESRASITPP